MGRFTKDPDEVRKLLGKEQMPKGLGEVPGQGTEGDGTPTEAEGDGQGEKEGEKEGEEFTPREGEGEGGKANPDRMEEYDFEDIMDRFRPRPGETESEKARRHRLLFLLLLAGETIVDNFNRGNYEDFPEIVEEDVLRTRWLIRDAVEKADEPQPKRGNKPIPHTGNAEWRKKIEDLKRFMEEKEGKV